MYGGNSVRMNSTYFIFWIEEEKALFVMDMERNTINSNDGMYVFVCLYINILQKKKKAKLNRPSKWILDMHKSHFIKYYLSLHF